MTTPSDTGAQRPSAFRIKGVETVDYAAVQAHITELEARPVAPQAFRVNGAETMDFAAVQAHITALEGFATETRDGARTAYVKSLVADGKIIAPLEAMFAKQAISMDDATFAEFKTGYDAAPKLSITADHGTGANAGGNAPAGAGGEKASEKLILEEQLQMHRNAGMSEDEISKTKAFKRLAQINSTQA